jgi:hypothetical protein
MQNALLVLLLLALPGHAAAQRVAGRVVDATTGAGIPNVEVRVESAGNAAERSVSDSTGQFVVPLREGGGRYRISAHHLAYSTSAADVELGAQDQVEVLIRMAVTALALPPLEVVARSRAPDPFLERSGYYERKAAGFGAFIEPDEIERRRPLNTSDLFHRISGVRVIMLGGIRGNDIRITRGEDPYCPPRIYIDRVMVRRGGRMDANDTPLDALIQPPNLHAIEIFRSPSEVPTEFGGQNVGCGVVVIWTKRGAARGP